MMQLEKTVAGRIIDSVAYEKALSDRIGGVTLGDLGAGQGQDRQTVARNDFERDPKRVSPRIKKQPD